ncbi:MAG TPA: hypothetical protein VMR28_03325 [Candidatus Saccharimonadales bacterium]|nr:hypothetical protein [Candidatus Saccharimonadales bacterium]
MNDLDPGYRRVIVEVHRDILHELMERLGEFATQYDISVGIADSLPKTSEPSIAVEATDEPNYNPDLMIWTTEPESGTKVAVITRSQFEGFAMENDHAVGVGGRTYKSILRSRTSGWRGGDSTGEYVHEDGLLASQLPELVKRLTTGNLHIDNVGRHGISLLGEYSIALFQDGPAE